MYLVFIDESGNSKAPREEIRNPSGTTLFLTFAAVAADMSSMHEIELKINDLKKRCFQDRYTEAKFTTKKEIFKNGITPDVYKKEYAELIRDSDITLISVVINKYQASKIDKSKQGMYKLGFQTLLSSLRDFQAQNGFADIALIVDSINDEHDKNILFGYQEALKSFDGHPGFYRNRFSPSIIFAKSTFTCGLQMVDFCAGAIQRSVELQDPTFASVIKSRLFSDIKTGRQAGFGFKMVPEKINGPGGMTSEKPTPAPISSPTAST